MQKRDKRQDDNKINKRIKHLMDNMFTCLQQQFPMFNIDCKDGDINIHYYISMIQDRVIKSAV